MNMKETAQAYEPPQTLVISDVEVVRTDIEMLDGSGKDKEGTEFTYKYCVIEDKKYRVPATVLEQLKTIFESKPDLKTFTVKKAGSGMGTKYTVVQLD